MTTPLLEALELIARGSVATTGLAIGHAGADLTFPQWRVLVVVGEHEEGATVSEIASRVGGHVSPVSRLVSRLERRGLVRAEKDPRDRRVTRVTLSDEGEALRSAVIARRRDALAAAIDGADPLSDEAQAALIRLAHSMLEFA